MPQRVKDDKGQRLWRNRRLFRWRTYDASLMDDFTEGKRKELSALTVDWHWGPKSPAFQAYDTFDTVLSVGVVTDFGTCHKCGGTRRRHACKGHDDEGARRSELVDAG